jgi:hypothetical protein
MAPPIGLEPMTYRLTAGCSTTELQGNMKISVISKTGTWPRFKSAPDVEQGYYSQEVANFQCYFRTKW